jgi:hypothetical protein
MRAATIALFAAALIVSTFGLSGSTKPEGGAARPSSTKLDGHRRN